MNSIWAELARQQRLHANAHVEPEVRAAAWEKIQKLQHAISEMRKQGYETWQEFQKWEQERYAEVGIPVREPGTMASVWQGQDN